MSDKIENTQPRPEPDYRMLSPITLAFMGDAVFEQMVREHLIRSGNTQAAKLHLLAIDFVNASAQAQAVQALLPLLEEDERAILRRGRNANTSHVPKNADILDYRHATGFEALFGYLFLLGRQERLQQLFELVVGSRAALGQNNGQAADPAGKNAG